LASPGPPPLTIGHVDATEVEVLRLDGTTIGETMHDDDRVARDDSTVQ
jgi:hypothetical protein